MGHQGPAGQGDIAGESSNAGGSSSEGLAAEETQPNYHLPATLDVSDGSGVSWRPLDPSTTGILSRQTTRLTDLVVRERIVTPAWGSRLRKCALHLPFPEDISAGPLQSASQPCHSSWWSCVQMSMQQRDARCRH